MKKDQREVVEAAADADAALQRLGDAGIRRALVERSHEDLFKAIGLSRVGTRASVPDYAFVWAGYEEVTGISYKDWSN